MRDHALRRHSKGADVIVCTYEDRPDAFVGVKILALSLASCCPDAQLVVHVRHDNHAFRDWADDKSNVTVASAPSESLAGWDVKPALLTAMLENGGQEVWWLDSDIVVTADWRKRLSPLSDDTFVAAEERVSAFGHNTSERTESLGHISVRVFPHSLCSCALRVTSAHVNLLNAWNRALQDPAYRQAQTMPFSERPWYFGGDQDVLEGLLGSDRFSTIPVALLERGRDIAHCFCGYGYTLSERARNLFRGLPPLVHAQGPKPWSLRDALFSELSPYCAAASPYAQALDEAAPWLEPRTLLARLLHAAAFGNPNLRDAPLALRKWMRKCSSRRHEP